MKKPAYGVSINEVDYEKDNLVSFLLIFKPGRLIYCSFFHSFFHWFSSFFCFPVLKFFITIFPSARATRVLSAIRWTPVDLKSC